MPGAVGDLGQVFGQDFALGEQNTEDMAAKMAAGRGLQALQALNQNPMLPGSQPAMPGAAPMPPGPPMAGVPGMGAPSPQPQASPPMGGPRPGMNPPAQGAVPPGSFAARFPQAPPQAIPYAQLGQGQAQAPPQAAPPPPPPQQQPQQTLQMPMGGMPGGPGAYSLQQIVQVVQRANPGAPPNVLFKAVAGLVPLMRPADQEYWKMMLMQQAQERIAQGGQRIEQNQQRVDLQKQESGAAPLGQQPQTSGPQGQQEPVPTTAAEKIAKDIHDEKQAPVFGGWGGMGVPNKLASEVRTAYARMYPNDNLAQKALKWQQEVKLVQTMGGPQQVRFRQLANSVKPFLADIEDLSRQMNQSGMNAWNDAQIKYESQARGNTPRGQLATRYITALAGIRGELAQLENGGYAPHDASWQTAYQQIDQARGVQAQLAALSEIKKIITYRIQGMDSVAPGMAPGQDNPYAPGGQQPQGHDPLGLR